MTKLMRGEKDPQPPVLFTFHNMAFVAGARLFVLSMGLTVYSPHPGRGKAGARAYVRPVTNSPRDTLFMVVTRFLYTK